MSVRPATALRRLIEGDGIVVAPGVYDGLSARLARHAGFAAVYATGGGIARSMGYPDLGLLGMTEVVERVAAIVEHAGVPVIADADTGYGNALAVRRTVTLYESAGVAGLHIEDQVAPKRCGHLTGHQVIPLDEFAGKIRAAVEARSDPDLLIIARTDAISAHGCDEALRRGAAAVGAGADVLFVEAPRTEAEIQQIARAFDVPLLFNYVVGGRSPLPPFAHLRELGYAIILLPVDTLLVAARAMDAYLRELRATDEVVPAGDRAMSFAEFSALIGIDTQLELAERYASSSEPAIRR